MCRSHGAWRWIVAKRAGLIELRGDIGLSRLAIVQQKQSMKFERKFEFSRRWLRIDWIDHALLLSNNENVRIWNSDQF